MPTTTIVRVSGEIQNNKQRAICDRVAKFFEFAELPLLILLDDVVFEELRTKIGPENRGIFIPTNEWSFDTCPWPSYIADVIRRKVNPFAFEYPFSGMVYIHGDTCRDELALTMTLAHELQHFWQYGRSQEIWAWNTVLMNCSNLIKREGLAWHDIPIEFEARLVAKRILQAIFGCEETELYIARKLRDATLPRDAEDWVFVQSLDTAKSYDCASKTRQIFQRLCNVNEYRRELNGLCGA